MKILSILGATGSIGLQTIEVVSAYHQEVAFGFLTVNTRIDLLAELLTKVNPHGVAIQDEAAYREFKTTTGFKGKILCGEEGICEAAAWSGADLVLSALVGFSGVSPTLAAIRQGKTICLANKETLVSAGELVMAESRHFNSPIVAVDSEHSAILQCIVGENPQAVEKIILTASGGPFRGFTRKQLEEVTSDQALAHPNWKMGKKITIDSSTLMNKGFEVIEARWLFDVPAERIEVVIHPESIVHSLVQFFDGSVKAQLGLPDMNLPIHYALCYPNRLPASFRRMDLTEIGALHFSKPDLDNFPCLQLAFDSLMRGGTSGTVVNAANEIAVAAFLEKRCRFLDIARTVSATLDAMPVIDHPSLSDIETTDRESRLFAASWLQSLSQ